jgi:5-methylcytosine-specific restriction endonuclease McrA
MSVKGNIRKWIFSRDEWRCAKCGATDRLSVDHVIPKVLGGDNKVQNLQTLCVSCNIDKREDIAVYVPHRSVRKAVKKFLSRCSLVPRERDQLTRQRVFHPEQVNRRTEWTSS